MLSTIALLDEKLIPAWQQPVSVLDLLAARQLNLETALLGSSLFLSDAPFTGHKINPIQFQQLLQSAQKLWRDQDFYFQLGHRLLANGIGPLKDALYHVHSLSQWADLVGEFALLLSPTIYCRDYTINAHERFLLFSSNMGLPLNSLQHRTLLVLISQLIKRSEKNWRVEFYLSENTPSDVDQFYVHVAGKCYFSSPFNGVRIRQTQNNNDDHHMDISTQVAINQCRDTLGEKHYLLPRITKLLWSNHPLTLNDTAEHIDTSPATLKRKLALYRVSFQALSDQMKAERAVIELLLKGTSLEQISTSLCFHDSSNFRRAFKRWTGMTPSSLKSAYRGIFEPS